MCEARIDFDGDTAIDVVGGLGDRLEDIAGIAHVGGGELADGGLDIDLAEFLELCVVRADLTRAFWKMDGLVVTPTTLSFLMSSSRLPDSMRVRDRSSSQMETPASEIA